MVRHHKAGQAGKFPLARLRVAWVFAADDPSRRDALESAGRDETGKAGVPNHDVAGAEGVLGMETAFGVRDAFDTGARTDPE